MNTQTLQQQWESATTDAIAARARLKAGDGTIAAVNVCIERANSLKKRLDTAHGNASLTAAIGRMTAGMDDGPSRPSFGGSLGQQFINSETFRWMKENRGSLPTGAWTSPSSELMATTLTEDSGSGGQLVVHDTRPGILPLPTRPLVMADLIAPGQTDSNTIAYMRETTFTNAADTVAEGAAKPESTIVFDAVTDPVRKIATWLPFTEEMLEDVPGLESYLNTRLRLGVQLAEDDQLLNGSVVAPDIVGFLNRSGLAAAQPRGADTNADCVLRQMAAIFTATGLAATGIVMNPTNWITIQLLKTATGEYISGNGPFSAPQAPTLWGVPVALTSAMPVNSALVGAFRTASQIFRKGGLRVETSNSHASFFVENKLAVRAEERLALAVYRPSAFGICTGLA
jgi:HK97 family phage major capsid protein